MACCHVAKRYMIIVLAAIGMCIVHAMRVNVGVTVVTILDNAAHRKVGTITAMANLPSVTWDTKQIGFLHSVFYIGYIVTQLPGGYLATKIPSNRLFGACILLSSALNLLLPVSIDQFTYASTCVVRALQGLSEGVLFPSLYAILRHWTIPSERGTMGSIVLTGVYLGPVVGLPAAGALTHFLGWQYVFYVNGAAGLLWFLFWLFISYEKPSQHPCVSQEEKDMMAKAQGKSALEQDGRVPWFAIFTSLPAWAINICHFARSFIFFLLLTNGPTYLNVFGYSIAENGILSSLPHLLMTLISATSGPIADWMLKDPMLNLTQIRKIMTCIGFGTKATCLLFLAFIYDGTTAMIYLTIGVGAGGLTIAGWHINHLDLAPRYASILVAISTSIGTVAGIINPIIVGVMTQGQTIEEWQHVFLLSALVVYFATFFYALFASGDEQPWAEPVGSNIRLINNLDPSAKPTYQTVATQPGSKPGAPLEGAAEKPSGDEEKGKDEETVGDDPATETTPGSDDTPSESDVRHRDVAAPTTESQ